VAATLDKRIYILHAGLCKTLANPKRLEILNALRDGEKQAKELLDKLHVSKANLSQHLAVLRNYRIIVQRRDGVNMFYRLSDQRMMKACDFIREVLFNQLAEDNDLLRKLGAKKTGGA